MANETSAHRLSEVLTGAMFDVLIAIGKRYQKSERGSATSPKTRR